MVLVLGAREVCQFENIADGRLKTIPLSGIKASVEISCSAKTSNHLDYCAGIALDA